MADPLVKNLFICAEIPFVGILLLLLFLFNLNCIFSLVSLLILFSPGNSPEEAKQGALNPKTPFLADHWPYNDKELVKLLEMIFKWKSEDPEGRDVIFIGGGI